MKKLMLLLLSVSIVLSANYIVFANTEQNNNTIQIKDENTANIKDYWVSPTEHVLIAEIDLGNGFRVIETTTEIRSMTKSNGFSFQKKEAEVYDGSSLITTVKVEGNFSYDGDKATVTSSSQTYTTVKSGYSMSTFTKAQGDSGILNDAYVKVNYKVTKQQNGNSVGSGKVEVTCSKNGK